MPQLKEELAALVAIPSISEWGFPEHTRAALLEAHQAVVDLLRDAGVQSFTSLELPGTAPVITGEIPGPEGAPTVLLYSHYDVVPAGEEALWTSPPFEATERDGAIYGRGTADTKANILVHVGALRAWGGRPPVGIKLLIEGQEEVGSPLEEGYPSEHPEHFRADAIIVADGGSIRAGQPSLTVSLRGDARITVEVRTLASNKHSGQYGGAAPDALVVLLRALASLHDEHGDLAVEGLRREEWSGESYTDEEFRALAEIEPGLPIVGTGSVGSRIWTGPSITVLGIDCPAVEGAAAAVQSHARASLNVRVHPQQSAKEAQEAVMRHLQEQRPFGVALEVAAGATGDGFRAGSSGAAWEAMAHAMEQAWGKPVVEIATGGAIPLVKAMSEGVPDAAIFVFGCTDSFANIHGPDERLLVDEWEKAVFAETLFFKELADRAKVSR
ncbi:M20/M25/M40 family metallo-hydrolase [Gaiella sp.]|uniref:M20/M25/M40 family metallo-hydrolase n=1 Tax=Gaiella sp. TaxID=2663207 RepID=UPI0039C8AC92